MDFTLYLQKFQAAANHINKKKLAQKQMEVTVGIYQQAVFLKLYKKQWANKTPDPLTSPSRIFFSVWITDDMIKAQKIFYNIHALKLRHLDGYAIASRDFAHNFRKKFNPFEHQWPNVSVQFGPLTLMEGWVKTSLKNLSEEILILANQFLEIDHLIDNVLEIYKEHTE